MRAMAMTQDANGDISNFANLRWSLKRRWSMPRVSRPILDYGRIVTVIDIAVAWSSVACLSVGATLLGALGQ